MFNLDLMKGIREERGLTQQQLADKSRVPIATIQKQEQGVQRDASLSIAIPLAEALGVSVEDLCSVSITRKNVKGSDQ